MQILNDTEDFGMHLHQLNESHTFVTPKLFEIDVKDLCKSEHNHINLCIVQNFKSLLVLVLKTSFVFHQQAWKVNEIYAERADDQEWIHD